MNKYLRIAISAALLGWIAWHTDWERVGEAFARLRVEYGLAAFCTLLICQVASARRWQVLARELRFDRSLRQFLGYYLIGMYFNLLLPTSVGGDVMRAWYLDGGSRRKLASLAAVLLDRLNGLVVLMSMACLAVTLSPTALPGWLTWTVWGMTAGGLTGIALLPIAQRIERLPPNRRQQLATMMQAFRAPRALVEATGWSAVIQVGNVLLVWMLGLALDVDVPLAFYFVFVPMVSLLTLLPISVNGMGVREGGVALFLVPLGVAQPTTLTLAFLWFAVFAVTSLLGGVVYLCGAYPKPIPATPIPATLDSNEVTQDHGSLGRDSHQGREGQLDQAA